MGQDLMLGHKNVGGEGSRRKGELRGLFIQNSFLTFPLFIVLVQGFFCGECGEKGCRINIKT